MNARIGAGAALIAASCMLGVIVMSGALAAVDTAILRALSVSGRGPAWLVESAQFISSFGELGARGVAVVLVLAALMSRHRWRSGVIFVVTILCSVGGHRAAKLFWARERPTLVPWLDSPHELSFPSGHAAASMVVLLLAALMFDRWRLVPIAVALALALGLTRPMLGVHWPTDVVGGWLWGAGFALIGAGVAQSMGLLDARYGVRHDAAASDRSLP